MNKQQFFACLLAGFIFFSCAGQSTDVLTPKDFKAKMSQPSVTLLDVRTPGEFNSGHLEKSANLNVNNSQFEAQCSKLDKTKTVLVYCYSGARSNRAAKMLRQKGFKVYELKGGMEAWQEEGLAVVGKR